jgi:hypothetical protein
MDLTPFPADAPRRLLVGFSGGRDSTALLHRLALMQYNDGTWRRSHPVVRTLEGYRMARAGLGAAPA